MPRRKRKTYVSRQKRFERIKREIVLLMDRVESLRVEVQDEIDHIHNYEECSDDNQRLVETLSEIEDDLDIMSDHLEDATQTEIEFPRKFKRKVR